jgi:hypothetical protein
MIRRIIPIVFCGLLLFSYAFAAGPIGGGGSGDGDTKAADDETITGSWTFDNGLVINQSGADSDTRVEGDTEPNLLVVDAGNDRVGIGKAAPDRMLEIEDDGGNSQLRLTYSGTEFADFQVDSAGDLTITPSADWVLIDDSNLRLSNTKALQWRDSGAVYRSGVYLDGSDNLLVGNTNFADISLRVGSVSDAVTIKATTGNVGIGETSPESKLDVNGTITATGMTVNGDADFTGTAGYRSNSNIQTNPFQHDFASIEYVNTRDTSAVLNGNLTHVDSDDQGDAAEDVWSDGNFIYLANDTGGLHVYSVNPAGTLTHVDSDDQGDNARRVWGDGNFIYLANEGGGLHTYSVNSSGTLTHIDSDDQGGSALGVWGDGKFIYLANYTSGLLTYSVDSSGNITYIDADDQGDNALGVWGDGKFVYLANDTGGLHTYSVDSSGILTHVDSDDQGDAAYEVWGDGTFIYLANYSGGLHTYSVSSSGILTHIDSDDQGGLARKVWGDGSYIYLANEGGGLLTYSVNSSGTLTYVDSDDQGDNALGVWGDRNLIYLANDTGGLHTYSVDNAYSYDKGTGVHAFTGTLDITNGLVINQSGADSDTRIEGDTDTNLVVVDAGNDRVGIGEASPGSKLDVNGNVAADDFIVGTTALSATTSPTVSGAYVIGVNDEFTNSNSSSVQGVLKDFDGVIGGGGWDSTVRTAAPGTPVTGRVYVADSDTWNPCSSDSTTDYLVNYNGTVYLPLWNVDGTPIVQTAAPGTPVENWVYYADANGTWDPDTEVTGTDWYAVRYNGTSYVSLRQKDGTLLFSSLRVPGGTDPDISTERLISWDTDGANESNDVTLRGYDGTNQFLLARKTECYPGTVIAPNDLADAQRDLFSFWPNNTGMTFNITEIRAWSDTDDTALTVEVVTATNWSSPTTVDALTISTDGTGIYYTTETTITDSTIAHDEIITLDFDDTDTPGFVQVEICGWFDANVD